MACALKMNFGICASKDEIFARNVIPQPHPEIQCMISNSLSISRYFKFPITFYIPYLHIEFEEWVIFFLNEWNFTTSLHFTQYFFSVFCGFKRCQTSLNYLRCNNHKRCIYITLLQSMITFDCIYLKQKVMMAQMQLYFLQTLHCI